MVATVTASLLVVAVDQVTKSLAQARLASHPVHLVGPLSLSLGYNSGAAFSLFTGDAVVLGVVVAIVVVVLAWWAWQARQRSVALAIGLVLGGAIGNLADRLFRGHHGAVIDFVKLTGWPTFNVADASITVGVAALVVLSLRRGSKSTTPPGNACVRERDPVAR